MSDKPTSAAILRARFSEQGICSGSIRGIHIAHIYPKLRRLKDAANFAQAENLLVNLRMNGIWGDREFAVIVETRDIPELGFVIENVATQTGLGIQLFHGNGNRSVLKSDIVTKLTAENKFDAVELDINSLNAQVYNALFLDIRFFNALSGRGKFLVFQTDSLCCVNSDFIIENFLAFDYVGARWNSDRPVGLRIDGGVGGFSLRDWAASVDALERFPSDLWPGGEDGFYGFHLDLMGRRVATPRVMGQFATQSDFLVKSFGAHQIKCLTPVAHARFLEYCPEIRNVLAWQT